ncbi:MAG TPA: hypothetical protein VF120_04655 [Ktedonobacterales bacterium]
MKIQKGGVATMPTKEQRSMQAMQPQDAQVAERMKKWERVLGPLLSEQRAQQQMGVETVEEMVRLRAERQVLALPTYKVALVYPAFQFAPEGQVRPEVALVLHAFESVLHDEEDLQCMAASWLRGSQAYLGGQTPQRWGEITGDVERVRDAAELTAARLEH